MPFLAVASAGASVAKAAGVSFKKPSPRYHGAFLMDDVYEIVFRRSGRSNDIYRVDIIRRADGRVIFSADVVLLNRDVLYKLVERVCDLAGAL